MPRDKIDVLARAARRAAANTLAALCVARGADYGGGDEVERAVLAMAAPDIDAAPGSASAVSSMDASAHGGNVGARGAESGTGQYDISTASEWPGGVGKEDVLIAPAEARSAWREFMSASTLAVQQVRVFGGWGGHAAAGACTQRAAVTGWLLLVGLLLAPDPRRISSLLHPFNHPNRQAKITQQANLAAGKRAPPIWAMAAIMMLGWNEFVAVVWNPIYLIIGFFTFMFGWMMYSELDIDARMQQGWVTGLLGIWGNLGDALQKVRRGQRRVGGGW
jgi:hypothetical protein